MQTIQDAKILVVDDNRELRNLIKEELTGAGYRADTHGGQRCGRETGDFRGTAGTGDSGHQPAGRRRVQPVPGDSGQKRHPILFLSARDADSDRLFGLGLGADDYLTKPFLMQELLLRISGILRRAYRGQLQRETALRLGERTVDLSDATVSSAGGTVTLTATERAILQKLLDNRGHIVTYDALCEAVWGSDYYGCENSLNVHIRHLREKVEEQPSQPVWILTARGLGYKLAKEGTK